MTTPDNLDAISTLGVQSATLATLIWFGRRFLAQHDQLIQRLDGVIAESARTRISMDAARESFTTKSPRNTRRTAAKRNPKPMAAVLLVCASIAAIVALSSCTVDSSYRAADRATYDAVAPAHRRYLETDALLTEEQRELALLVLETWRVRVETAESE